MKPKSFQAKFDVHKVSTPLIHNFGLIVYQMRNIEKPKKSSFFLKKSVYEPNNCGGVKDAH